MMVSSLLVLIQLYQNENELFILSAGTSYFVRSAQVLPDL